MQFPEKLALSMTINKSQGQTLEFVGMNLEEDCFAHGQLYVACSRVKKPNNLYYYSQKDLTSNIVFREILN